MKHLFFLFFIFCSVSVFGQDRNLHIYQYKEGELSLWYTWNLERDGKIGLDTVQFTRHTWYFRFRTDNQVIDVWTDSLGTSSGRITSWAKEYVPYDEKPTNRIYSESKLLDSNQVAELIQFIDSIGICEVPDQHEIEEWRSGFDGITYQIETADSTDYYFKTYWTPTAQDSLEEAILVQAFVDRTMEITNANEAWRIMSENIPYPQYQVGMFIVATGQTKKERRRSKRERKRYRKHMR